MIGKESSALPARFGGLRLLSHRDCSHHAFAAARESAEEMVGRIFGTDEATNPESLRSQSVRCNEMWEEKQQTLAKVAGPFRASIILENSSVVARKWLETLPLFQPLRISNSAVATGLRYRTLAKPHQPGCRCGKMTDLGHEETCSHSNFVARHNSVRDAIAAALRTAVSTNVITELRTDDGLRRNNVGLRGPGKSGRCDIDYDIKVYSMCNQYGARSIHRPIKHTEADHLKVVEERTTKWFQAIEAKTTYNAPENHVQFKPFVLSSGGMMSPVTLEELDTWRKELGKMTIDRLLQRVSISLLENRAILLASSLSLGDGPAPGLD